MSGATGVGLARDEDKPQTAAHAGGEMGERDAAFALGKKGFELVVGPGGGKGHKLTERGFDIVGYNPKTKELWIVDNKASGGTRKVQDASAITKNILTNLKSTIAEVGRLPNFKNKYVILSKLRATVRAIEGGKSIPSDVALVVTNAGGGASFCRGRAVTRHRDDPTRDPGGQFLYLRDVWSGSVWSATHQPIGRDAEDVDVAFTMGKATFQRRDGEIATRLDVAVSNPPYIADASPLVDDSVRRWEPHDALFAGADGLDDIRIIAEQAGRWLRPGGWLVLEIGADQGSAVADLLVGTGFGDVDIRPDLAGRDRVAVARVTG